MAVTWITAADLSDPTDENAAAAAESASWILYRLSGEKYAGVRTATEWIGLDNVDPRSCMTFTDYGDFTWVSAHESAKSQMFVRPRGKPVVSIESIATADGIVDPDQYELVNYGLIYSKGSPWNLSEGMTVSYTYGNNPPAAGILAAKRLGNELLAALVDAEACGLPERVINSIQSVDRQGVSFTILDPQTFLLEGRTGMYEVDLFIKAANPSGAKKRPRVFSPDLPKGRRTT